MNVRRVLLAIMFIATAIAANGQQVKVTVLDDEHHPVELAYVNIYSPEHRLLATGQTDSKGYAAVAVEKYPAILEAVASGYERVTQKLSGTQDSVIAISFTKKFASLNEVVITGLSQPQKLKNALSSYQVITKATIQAQGAVTLNEVLKTQLNMSVGNDGILGSSIRMQGLGTDGSKVKILVDGIPMNGRENGSINLSQINMNNVERIEVIQGPMSVVYGTDALGGIINVITKKENKPFGINAGWYYETLGKYNFDGALTFKALKHHQFTLGGGRNFFEGWQNIDSSITYHNDTLLTQRNLLYKPNEQYLGNAAYTYTANSGFKLNLATDYMKEKVTNRGNLSSWDPFTGAYAFDEYYYTTRLMNRLSMEGKLGKTGHWQTQNGFAEYYRKRNRVIKDMVTLQETPTANTGDQDTTRFNDTYLRASYNNKLKKIDYTVGYDINLESAFSLKINGHHKTLQDYAVYTNIAVPIIEDKLTAQLGLRAAHNSLYAAPVIPALNLLYTPSEKIQVRGSYAKGFRAPSLKEQYLSFIDLNHHIIGNENLKAEKSDHVQASASYQLYQKRSDYVQVILTGYFNNVSNQITLVSLDPTNPTNINYTYGNLTHQRNAIASLQTDGQKKDFHFILGYSFTHTFGEDGYYDPFSAQEATATLQYALQKADVNFSLFYKYIGHQPFLVVDVSGTASYNGMQNGFSLCDASVEKKFYKKTFQVIVGVKNIFDIRTPGVSGGIAQQSVHGTAGGGSFLPRSIFTNLRINID